MIDRIRIYINDVGFEDVETRLDLSPSGIDKDGSFKYCLLYTSDAADE